MRIEEAFGKQGRAGSPLNQHLRPMIDAFASSDAADHNYIDELASGDEGQFWSRVWEAMLYWRFHQLGWKVSGAGAGPDFHVETPEGLVLVEATVPSPDGIPADYLTFQPGVVKAFPHEQILLRWTSKLADKRNKHVEDIAKGRASTETPFVIAINSCRLSYMPEENGISQWPFAVEATFPIGPIAVPVDPQTGAFGKAYQSLRFSVAKKPGVDIPTGNFLDPEYACVSALIGCAACFADDTTLAKFAGQPPFFVVHNPLATNSLPLNWLPNSVEFAATQDGPDDFTLSRLTER